MINNVVLMFSPTAEETPYEQGENQSVAARSIIYKFLKRCPAWTKPERVWNGFIVCFTSSLDQ